MTTERFNETMKKVLVTGSAGFIGYHLSRKLLMSGFNVVGIDSLNDYYDVNLKCARLDQLLRKKDKYRGENWNDPFIFYKQDLTDKELLSKLFETEQFNYVIHLAAQAGVRYSIQNPKAYIDSNITGFFNILEACRAKPPEHLIFASSSSVYGLNQQIPFSTTHHADHPVSLYAATKKANEMMAHSYAQLFKLPITGLRFFTVYGPWGRPDMAYFSFTKKILAGEPIDVYNNGDLIRDFTYIDDIVNGLVALIDKPPAENPSFNNMSPDPSLSSAPYRLFNIGNHTPVRLMDFIQILEDTIGIKANKTFKPMQPGDVYATYADINELTKITGFEPVTSIETGLRLFIDWYLDYYK